MSPGSKLLWLAAAGAAGTLARYGVTLAVHRVQDGGFPWATMMVNLVGCFLFGLVWTLGTERAAIDVDTRGVILVGFMGAFTTFSSFAFDTAVLWRNAEWTLAGLNLVAQNGLGLAALFLGMTVARSV